jgi:hypothetical protein
MGARRTVCLYTKITAGKEEEEETDTRAVKKVITKGVSEETVDS